MRRHFIFISILALAACQRVPMAEPEAETLQISVSLEGAATKTVLGPSQEGSRKVFWADGDALALNGTASEALSGVAAGTASATFKFRGSFTAPYHLLYPAALYKDAATITLPAAQTWADGTFDPAAAPLAASLTSADGAASLGHLCTIVQLRVKKDAAVSAANLAAVTFKGNAGEQVCGDFAIDYAAPALTPDGTGAEMVMTVNQPLSESEALDIFLVVPAQTYASGFSVVLRDADNRYMTMKTGSITLPAGKLFRGAAFTFVPSLDSSFELEDIVEEVIAADGYNVTGRVVDADTGKGLDGVVVSDGLQCVRTMPDGSFYMTSNLTKTKFVFVSTPSGYLPPVSGGIPQYYKLLSSGSLSGGVYNMGTYALTPDASADPDHFTLLVSADPQERSHTKWDLDNAAYRSVRCREDLFKELKNTAADIKASGQNVYGICLGDLVHEDMELLGNYASAMGDLGYPTWNVIGNHDYDTSKADDDAGAAPFESHFGPRNYSFNIGGIHFVVLDNLMMKKDGTALTAYDEGLTDDIWAWLQADLNFVPNTTKLMVCAHAPMFRRDTGAERTGGSHPAAHGPDYGGLINKYAEVHAWAGHTHTTFNFNYEASHRNANVQVHTLARSTGELWTNEYVSEGTPRGFTVVEVNHGEVSWKFHPTQYQKAAFQGGSDSPSYGAPAYVYRDWDYAASSPYKATMRGGGDLTEAYQMHVYAPGAYEAGYVYANIFLWDDKWETPTFSLNGGTAVAMTHLAFDAANSYDRASCEIQTYYKNNSHRIKTLGSSYGITTTGLHTIFKVPVNAASGSGTVSVTDRFGNVYTRTISW